MLSTARPLGPAVQQIRLPKESNTGFERKISYRLHSEMPDECQPHSMKGNDLPAGTKETAVMLMTEMDQVVSL
jgi:hypothetical protein